jgi:hypothetical protein
MPLAALEPLIHRGPAMLLGGMVALFACSRMLAVILPRQRDALGVRALAYFIPIAAASLVAALLGRPEIAVAIVFGTSVGAMTSVVGFIAVGEPLDSGPPRWRRLWPFLLAAALLVFVIGFKGTFNWHDAIALATEGLILYTLWNDRADASPATPQTVLSAAVAPATGPIPLNYAAPGTSPCTVAGILLLILELLMVAVLLWLGGWSVTRGTVAIAPALRGMSTSGLAGSLVSLSMVLPMMFGSWRLSTGGRGWAPVTTQIGVVMLNLCALLPILILLPYAAVHIPQVAHFAGDSMLWNEQLPKLLIFPSPMWRIDNVILIIMGVFLLPVAIGKWNLGREEGMVLIAAYFFYLTATVASGLSPGMAP